jgi:hypothetical protein
MVGNASAFNGNYLLMVENQGLGANIDNYYYIVVIITKVLAS